MVSKAQYENIALSLAGTEMRPHYGQPSVMAFGKFLTRLRQEDDLIVIRVGSIDERDALLELDPDTFTLTDHYRDYPAILARRAKMDAKRLRHMLAQHWRRLAPKKMVKEKVDARPGAARRRAPPRRQCAKRTCRER